MRLGDFEMEIIGRIRSRRKLTSKFLMISAFAATMLSSCSEKEQVISGKPASFWLTQLEDSNPEYVANALEKLQFSDNKTKEKLRTFMIENRTRDTLFANELYRMDGSVFPDCGTAYLSGLVSYVNDESYENYIYDTAYGKYFKTMVNAGKRAEAIAEFDTFVTSHAYPELYRRTADILGIPWKHAN